jgi:NAD(P)-dependent dehydrogenase (short-subunit alcohol dehydrogenase family)
MGENDDVDFSKEEINLPRKRRRIMKNMKTAVVTGATSGIGFAVCEKLLQSGCRVLGIGRSEDSCRAAEEKLRSAVQGGDVAFYPADLLRLTEVRAVAGRIREELERSNGGKLDALVNNAGCVRSWYMTTPEGYEHQFALNHLAGFLLTHELLENLVKGSGVILLTSSGSHKMMKINWNDIMFQRRYRPLMAYKQSKLCNMLFARAVNDRFADKGIRAYGIDPGLVRTDIGCKNTGGLVDFVWKRRKKHGVEPSVPAGIYAGFIDRDDKPYGLYYSVDGERPYSREVTRENADRLTALSEKLLNIKLGVTASCLS